MKKLFWILLVLSFSQFSCTNSNNSQHFNVISFNIRFDNPNDGINAWPNRKDNVAALLKFHDADIFCLQEALYSQILDIEQRLPDYSWVGVGRDDGEKAGEFIPIFFNVNKFILLEWGTFWLSDTSEEPSLGWDAACFRVCTWAKLRVLQSDTDIFVLNTHFDHVGSIAQQNSAGLIMNRVQEIANGYPVVLAGDFNVLPDSTPIQGIEKYLNDAFKVSLESPYGPIGTWNAFDYSSSLDRRIDYVFINEHLKVLKYANLSDANDQRFPSDHLPVFVRLTINK
jgi:endonuclease/exonuclease/phosphatase family metal-dependent hydrolase